MIEVQLLVLQTLVTCLWRHKRRWSLSRVAIVFDLELHVTRRLLPRDDPGAIYREALTTSVRTKALTEEERKLRRAEQKDFRSNLVRRVG